MTSIDLYKYILRSFFFIVVSVMLTYTTQNFCTWYDALKISVCCPKLRKYRKYKEVNKISLTISAFSFDDI